MTYTNASTSPAMHKIIESLAKSFPGPSNAGLREKIRDCFDAMSLRGVQRTTALSYGGSALFEAAIKEARIADALDTPPTEKQKVIGLYSMRKSVREIVRL